ncbi:flagellar hook-associated protein FlgK [Amantichitinum ursilacus]|uniref:Flagellar hook-associated protein 1 n=1 Tax=Amantichitinum ursilacus TaxID=857265 RepID=A0A0N0XKM4_9NEIS|nr:flagellar hook-associated protein FlgK [Amantichitinum ursilacus]KPC54809.1 Flagellar hook-associated protein 1 [Amantichitinum ursilacus]
MSVFSIGVSALNAANLGLTTTGHNIANEATPGYSRQSIKQSAPYPQLTGSGFVGMGVRVDTIQRAYDQFLTKQQQGAQTQDSYLNTYLTHLNDIDNIVADPTAGVSPAMQDFFSSVQNVATSPADTPSRTAMLTSAGTLVSRFQSFNDQLNENAQTLNGEISTTVDSINSITKQIATLNGQIATQSASGQPPNDLLDQRDQLVLDLNKYVKATTLTQSDGSMNVFIGSGQNVVVGGNSFNLAAVASRDDPTKTQIAYQQNNVTVYLPDSQITGGSLQGLLTYRNDSLSLAQNTLNLTALGLAQTFNAQHRAGIDLNGDQGQNLFDYPRADNVDMSLNGQKVTLTAPDNAIPQSDYALSYNVTSGNYTLTRSTDGQTASITAAQLASGFTALGVTATMTGADATATGTSATASFPPALGNVFSNTGNTGNAALTGYISDTTKLTSSNYKFSYDGTQYVMTRLSDNTQTVFTPAQVAAGAVGADGIALKIKSGTMNAGDSFEIQPVSSVIQGMSVAISDPTEVAASSPITAAVGKGAANTVTFYGAPSNTGTALLSGTVSDKTKLTGSDYKVSYDGTNYSLTRISDGVSTTAAGFPLAMDGFTVNLNSGSFATGDSFTVVPPGNNSGTLTITQPTVDAPPTSTTQGAVSTALKNPVTINFNTANSFTITDAVTGVTTAAQNYTKGMTVSFNGWSMKLDGTPAAGDSIGVAPNTSGNADGRNALALESLQTTKLLDNGKSTYADVYGQMVSKIGTQTAQAKIMATAQDTVLTQATTARDSLAGVNLDEEAANLLRYQQAYTAASKVIQIAQQTFQAIENIIS